MLNEIIYWMLVPYAGVGLIVIHLCVKCIESNIRKLGTKSRDFYQQTAIGFCKTEFGYWLFIAAMCIAWPITMPAITIWAYIVYKRIK